MSTKAVTPHYQVVTNGDMAGTVTSLETVVVAIDNCAYQVIYTGAPVGIFYVEATIDGVNWTALVFSTPITPANSPSPFLINLNQVPYRRLRLRYVPSSGSGTMQAWFCGKAV